MTKLAWDAVGEKVYEAGVDHGVLFVGTGSGYDKGVAWNGLTAVNEAPSGAEANPQYADNIKYINLVSAEEFAATIEAYTYPEEFEKCDGSAELTPGVTIGQQARVPFAFSYRTKVGNDAAGLDFGYKIHIVYGAQAAPSERSYGSINESPEPVTFSWEISTTPVPVTGFKPSATATIDSTKVDPTKLAAFEKILYGGTAAGEDPTLLLPDAIDVLLSTP